MGKFSKPRNAEWYQNDFQNPVPTSPVVKPQVSAPVADEFENSAVSAEEICEEVIPETPDTDDFFDTPEYTESKGKTSGSSKKLTKILLICLCSVLVVALVGGIGAFGQLVVFLLVCYVGSISAVEYFQFGIFVISLDEAIVVVLAFLFYYLNSLFERDALRRKGLGNRDKLVVVANVWAKFSVIDNDGFFFKVTQRAGQLKEFESFLQGDSVHRLLLEQ